MHGQISLSLMCNLRHSFCFQSSFSTTTLSRDVLYHKLLPMYPQIRRLRLLGGEPTIIPGAKEYIVWLKENYPHIDLEIVTNGVAFDDAWRALAQEHGLQVQVSVNAVSDKVFAKIMRMGSPTRLRERIYSNLEKLVELHHQNDKPIINCISMVLNDDTAEDLRDMVLYALGKGLNLALQLPAESGNDQMDQRKNQFARQALDYAYFCRGLITVDTRLIPEAIRKAAEDDERDLAAERERFLAEARGGQGVKRSRNPIDVFLYLDEYPPGAACLMPTLGFVLTATGDMLPCCHLSNFPIGNIHLDTAEELMGSVRRLRLQRMLADGDYRYCWNRCKYNRAPASSVPGAADGYVPKHQELFDAGRYELAAQRYERFAGTPPYTATECYRHAFCLHMLGRGDEALRLYGQALERGAPEFLARANRANLLLDLGRTEEARADLRAAQALDASYQPASSQLGPLVIPPKTPWTRDELAPASQRPAGKTVFVAGYFGYRILGDDAVLEAMLAKLRAAIPGAAFVVTSIDPPRTAALHCVEAVAFSDLEAVNAGIRGADLVLVGGGGVFNEYDHYRPELNGLSRQDFNTFCSNIPLLAAAAGKPCAVFAVGVEPLYSAKCKEDVRLAFELAQNASVRDAGSLEVLRGIGCDMSRVTLSADPTVTLAPEPDATETPLAERLPGKRTLVAVSLRHWNVHPLDMREEPNAWEEEVAAALEQIIAKHDAGLVFIPFHSDPMAHGSFSDDLPIIERIYARLSNKEACLVLPETPTVQQFLRLVGSVDFMVGMRFHSIMIALSNAVPCVAIEYSLKVRSAMRKGELEDFSLPIKTLTADRLVEAFGGLKADSTRRRARLKQLAGDWRHASEQDYSRAAALLDQPPPTASRLAGKFADLSLAAKRMITELEDTVTTLGADRARLASEVVAQTEAAKVQRTTLNDKLKDMETHLFDQAFKTLAASGAKAIGIYGAGQHTCRLLADTRRLAGFDRVMIFDDDDEKCGNDIAGVKIFQPSSIPSMGVQALLVSSDTYEGAMLARLRSLTALPIHTIYS